MVRNQYQKSINFLKNNINNQISDKYNIFGGINILLPENRQSLFIMIAQNFENILSQKISKCEFLTYWLSFEQVANFPKKGRSFQKLKPLSQFRSDHEITLIELYLQKIYLFYVAQELDVVLQTSVSFFELKEGLIFGIYHFRNPQNPQHKYKGVEMKQEQKPYLKNIYDNCIGQMFKKIMQECGKTNLTENSELNISFNNLVEIEKQLYETKATCAQFLNHLEKQPLSEHYLYKIKLKNAMLTPMFYSSPSLLKLYKNLKSEKVQLLQRIQIEGQENTQKKQIRRFHQIMQNIIEVIYKENRIGRLDGSKKVRGRGFYDDFVIILSQYRNNIEEKKQKIKSKEDEKKNKKSQKTKIQIKACNGLIQPKSGNAIFVNLNWDMDWHNGRPYFYLKIECYNNHKVQELYYTQILQFWNRLQGRQDFQELTFFNKFSMSHNEQTLEVSFHSILQSYQMPQILRELDKTVGVLLSMDQVVQICQRKGQDTEQAEKFEIKGYLYEKTISKLRNSFNYLAKHTG